MRYISMLSLVLGLLGVATSPCLAAKGTCDEASALLGKAVAYYKAEGQDKAFAKFKDKDGGFIDRDLYVFALNRKGVFLENAAKPSLEGRDSMGIKDPDGTPITEKFLAIKDKGSVDYRWSDPTDNKVKPKTTYVEWVGDAMLGVGCYKE